MKTVLENRFFIFENSFRKHIFILKIDLGNRFFY